MVPWRFYLLIFLLGLTVIITLWLQSIREQTLYSASTTNARVPDQILQGVTLIATDPSGKLQYRVEAGTMTHFSDDGSTELDAPRIRFYSEGAPPLEIESDHAWASRSRDKILLRGKVRIAQPKSPTTRPYTVLTKDVHVLPNERTASTDQKVVAFTTNARIQGLGGEIDLIDGTVTIRTQVRGMYEP